MNSSILSKTKLWLSLFWGWTVLTIILTTLPSNPELVPDNKIFEIRVDYLEHIFFYAVLSFLFFPSHMNRPAELHPSAALLWLAAGISFAIITEAWQVYIPGRAFNPYDMIFNITGIIAGIPAGKYLLKKLRKKNIPL